VGYSAKRRRSSEKEKYMQNCKLTSNLIFEALMLSPVFSWVVTTCGLLVTSQSRIQHSPALSLYVENI
jgi:hypothetical protein